MGKIVSVYKDDLDRAWFDSSNILYGECHDNTNELKKVIITFKNGGTYQYNDVKVNDWLKFRESASSGKGFIQYIKPYEFEKLENKDVDLLKEELNKLLEQAKENGTTD